VAQTADNTDNAPVSPVAGESTVPASVTVTYQE
jgi:hypothetical protein